MGKNLSFTRLTWRRRLLAAFFIVLYPVYLAAQEDSGPLVLEHADKLESSNANGDIVNLIGNVHFYHDKADIYSQRATWYQASGLIQFVDSVVVTEQGRRLTAQTVTYYRRDRRITALHDVVLVDSAQDMQLHCQRADYFRNSKQLDATGAPELILNPSDDTSRMVIDAQRLTYFGADSYGSAYDSVLITRHDMVAHAGQADFFRNPERAILYKDPDIINGQNELSGDTISIFTESRKLNRVLVQDNAKAIYKALPDTAVAEYTTAEIDGRQLEAFFGDDKIQLMVSRQNATSLYAPAVTDTLIRGTNVASGDSITLFFNDGTIKRVYISGGAQGEFIEPKFTGEGKGYLDTTRYSADEIDYNFDNSEIDLTNNGAMHYHDMALTAGRIRYETNTRILVAEGLSTDSSDDKYQPPVLKQGTEELHGDKMSYNIDSRKGQVRMARTKYENGYYSGETLRQASENELLVSQGNYSSCDQEVDPHYHFHSNRMKMINKNKVIARPVILYIGDLPVFAIPYYVFPIRKGRHSGFLPFELGSFRGGSGSRFIRNLGYYWAASDYYDLLGSLDFYENSHTTINGSLQYRLIYRLNGVVTVNYTHQSSWNLANYKQNVSNSWRIRYSHNQILSETMTLGGSGTFVSNKSYIAQNVYDPAERLDRTITSDFNLSKAWPEQSVSMYVQARQDWNLDTDEKTQSLPSFSIRRNPLPLFPPALKSKKKTRIRPDEVVEEPTNRWYNSIYFDISTSGQNYRQQFKVDSTFFQKNYQTINTNSNLSLSSKFFGFLNVQPGVRLTHSMVRLEPGELPDSLGLPTGKFVTRVLYNTGVSVNTPVFGTVYPNKFGIIGLRHTMTPSISYSFTPAITKNRRYFSYVGGGTGSTRAKSLSYTLNNLFQAKYKSGEEEKRLDLFTLNFSGDYNMAARDLNINDRKLGDLKTSFRANAIPVINLDVNTRHSFYDLNSTHKRRIYNPRLKEVTINANLSGSYHPGGGERKEGDENDISKIQAFKSPSSGSAEPADLGIGYTLTYSYTNNKSTGKSIKTQWIEVTTQIQPTRNWHVDFTCHYDITNKQISSQNLSLTRDMHCWQASFTWIPSGVISGYYARISIKTLPDIKVESSRGGVGQRGGFNY